MVSRKRLLLYTVAFIAAHTILYLTLLYKDDGNYWRPKSSNLNFVIKVRKIGFQGQNGDSYFTKWTTSTSTEPSTSTTTKETSTTTESAEPTSTTESTTTTAPSTKTTTESTTSTALTTTTTTESTTPTARTTTTTTESTTPATTTTAPPTTTTTSAPTTPKKPSCPYPVIHEKTKTSNYEKITCKPNQLSQSACDYVTKEFPYDFDKHKCGTGEVVKICEFEERKLKFKCNYKACGEDFEDEIFVHIFKDDTGWYEMEKPGYKESTSLEKAVLEFAKQSRWSQDMLFLSCNNVSKKTQLLHFDSGYFKKTEVPTPKEETPEEPKDGEEKTPQNKKLNINIVWLDSLSRRHFFRSLPKTVETMNKINRDKDSKAEILDYELMQSVHGHTHESLIAFSEGKVLPKSMSQKERDNVPVKLQNLFKFMHDSGYRVLHQEDMCHKGGWGLNSEFDGSKDWQKLMKNLEKESYIDDLGMNIKFQNQWNYNACRLFNKSMNLLSVCCSFVKVLLFISLIIPPILDILSFV